MDEVSSNSPDTHRDIGVARYSNVRRKVSDAMPPMKTPAKATKTKPVSLRLTLAEFEQLQARAYPLSASATGIARDLIRTGLAGGDNKALADRLMMIERRLAAIEQQNRDIGAGAKSIDQSTRSLVAMFDALLKALTGDGTGRLT